MCYGRGLQRGIMDLGEMIPVHDVGRNGFLVRIGTRRFTWFGARPNKNRT